MRKAIAVAVLLVLGYNIAGYYLVHCALLWMNSERVEAMRESAEEDSACERITLSAAANADLRWNATQEFQKDGVRYDVMRTERSGDSLIVYAVRDVAEDALEHGITEHHDDAHAASHHALLEPPIDEGALPARLLPESPVTAHTPPGLLATSFPSRLIAPSTPPPRG